MLLTLRGNCETLLLPSIHVAISVVLGSGGEGLLSWLADLLSHESQLCFSLDNDFTTLLDFGRRDWVATVLNPDVLIL